MLRAFFERESGNKELFAGLKIMDAGEVYTGQMGKYPVISLSLKSAKQPDYRMAYESIIDEISKEYQRQIQVLDSDRLLDSQKEQYRRIMGKSAKEIEYAKALEFLSACLARVHEQNVIILIDEYDVPLENAYFAGFYKEMTAFIQSEVDEMLEYYQLQNIKERFEQDKVRLTMAIPNAVIRYIYRNTILEWFQNQVDKTDFSELYAAIQAGESRKIEEGITNQLVETSSFYDYAENYYHGFLCGGWLLLWNLSLLRSLHKWRQNVQKRLDR